MSAWELFSPFLQILLFILLGGCVGIIIGGIPAIIDQRRRDAYYKLMAEHRGKVDSICFQNTNGYPLGGVHDYERNVEMCKLIEKYRIKNHPEEKEKSEAVSVRL